MLRFRPAPVLNKCDTWRMGVLDGPVRDGSGAILYPQAATAAFQTDWRQPSAELLPFVQDYWITTWDRRELAPYDQMVLPSPSVNITIKRGRSRIAGLSKGVFTERLEGRHLVFGVRFRPGGFRPFLKSEVSGITGRFLPIGTVFGRSGDVLEDQMFQEFSIEQMMGIVENFLIRALPAPDPLVDLAASLVAEVALDPSLTRVDELARRSKLGVRQLQRIFSDYVGASPKWVIRRFRMQEAAARSAAGPVDWAGLAFDLGYSDQAHFCRDFVTSVGVSPAKYARQCGTDRTK